MSVAYDLFPEAHELPELPELHELHELHELPEAPRLRLLAPAGAPAAEPRMPRPAVADVVVLHAPRSVAPPVRLTRRGVVVLALAIAALAVALVWAAAASAPSSSGSASAAGAGAGVGVTVRPGDTLWSIATRVAPSKDPRAEVDLLRRVNHLAGVALVPGQVLALR